MHLDSFRKHLRGQDHHYPITICPVSKLTAPGHVLGTGDTNYSDLIPATKGSHLVEETQKHQTRAKLPLPRQGGGAVEPRTRASVVSPSQVSGSYGPRLGKAGRGGGTHTHRTALRRSGVTFGVAKSHGTGRLTDGEGTMEDSDLPKVCQEDNWEQKLELNLQTRPAPLCRTSIRFSEKRE